MRMGSAVRAGNAVSIGNAIAARSGCMWPPFIIEGAVLISVGDAIPAAACMGSPRGHELPAICESAQLSVTLSWRTSSSMAER